MNESKIWVTSDWHFCHIQPFLFEPRGFSSPEEMNEEIIRRHNKVVSPNDDVYFLGDAIMNDNIGGIACLKQLNGRIHMILGNHDSANRINLYNDCPNVVEVIGSTFLKYRKYHFYLSHYPTLTDNYDDDKSLRAKVINLCSHRHTQNKWCDWDKGIIYHCEMDAHNCYPVEINTIIEEVKEKLNEI